MSDKERATSKKLSKLDLNKPSNEINIYTCWCRIAYAEFEQWNAKEHAHSFWELHLCLGGNARILVGGTENILTENTYVFLPPKSKHTILFESKDYKEFVWGFSIENNQEINGVLYEKYKKAGVLRVNEEMLNCISLILENTKNAEFGSYNIIKNQLYYIFVLLARAVKVQNDFAYHKKHNELDIIRKYIRENLSNDISIRFVIFLY